MITQIFIFHLKHYVTTRFFINFKENYCLKKTAIQPIHHTLVRQSHVGKSVYIRNAVYRWIGIFCYIIERHKYLHNQIYIDQIDTRYIENFSQSFFLYKKWRFKIDRFFFTGLVQCHYWPENVQALFILVRLSSQV